MHPDLKITQKKESVSLGHNCAEIKFNVICVYQF